MLAAIFFAALSPAQTLTDHQPIKVTKAILRELRCMELNLYHEARGESLEGVKVVANVTLNRTKSKDFPNTVCGVVKQPRQFSWVSGNIDKIKLVVEDRIRQVAFESLLSTEWKDNTGGALYFHNETVSRFNRPFIKKMGGHYLYR